MYVAAEQTALVLAALLLLLLTTGLAVRLTVLAGAATTTTTILLHVLGTTGTYFGHVSVSGGEIMRVEWRPVCTSDMFGDLSARWQWRWPQTRGSSW